MISSFFFKIFKIEMFSISPIDLLFDVGKIVGIMRDSLDLNVSGVGTSDLLIGVLFVYFIFQISLVALSYFVPKLNSRGYDIFIVVLCLLLIVYMGAIIYSIKASITSSLGEIGSLDYFVNNMLGDLYKSLRKSIYLAILILLGVVLCKVPAICRLADRIFKGSAEGDDFSIGGIKGAVSVGNTYVRNAIDSGERYVKSSASNRKYDIILEKIKQNKLNIGKEVYYTKCYTDETVSKLAADIDAKIEEYNKREVDLLALSGKKKCLSCSNIISINSMFCSECGNKVETLSQAAGVMSEMDLKKSLDRISKEITILYYSIGEYMTNVIDTNSLNIPQLEEYVEILKNLEYELRECEEEKLRIEGKIRCSGCSNIIASSAKFCEYCGKSTAQPTQEIVEEVHEDRTPQNERGEACEDRTPQNEREEACENRTQQYEREEVCENICPQCGIKNEEIAIFCANCGYKLK